MSEQTSIEEYDPQQHKSTVYKDMVVVFSRQQNRIYNLLKGHMEGLTYKEISQRTGYPLASCCGRINELRDLGIVTHHQRKKDRETGHYNFTWVLTYGGVKKNGNDARN